MPFSPEVRTKVLVRCARICCLCFKQCGLKIEVHHIEQEADGGANTEDNALPVCFDCHAEVGSYNVSHPKGTKYRPTELVARRESLYSLVESGTLQAQMLARQIPKGSASKVAKSVDKVAGSIAPTKDATDFLEKLLRPSATLSAIASKLRLLGPNDTAWLVDSLVEKSKSSCQAISALSQILSVLTPEQQLVVTERSVRNVTLFGTTKEKTAALSELSSEQLSAIDESVRHAFFDDAFDIVKSDQFTEVNDLVPVLVNKPDAIPQSLWGDYVLVLIGQACSQSYRGGPAAKHALMRLPDALAIAGLTQLRGPVVCGFGLDRWRIAQEFAGRYLDKVSKRKEFVKDLATMKWNHFRTKYDSSS